MIEEFNWAPDRSGSAVRIRNGRKLTKRLLSDDRARPLWKRQLRGQKKQREAFKPSLAGSVGR